MKFSLAGIAGFVCCGLMFTAFLNVQPTAQLNAQQTQQGARQNQATNPQQTQQSIEYQRRLQQQQAQQQAQAQQMPPGFPLAAEQQKYIEELLVYWERYSDDVKRYRCNFTRWQYDHEVCNYRKPGSNQLVAAVISKGKVRFSDPDNGMYEVLEKWQFAGPPKAEGQDPEYIRPAIENPEFTETEKWICDGQKIYEYDFQNKRLYELTLPPEAQGEGLKNSPLPFVFGAKAAELLDRYWIRDVTPKDLVGQQYWLEAWPKRITDAQAYSKVEIILSPDPFLPLSIHLYAPNYDPKTNPSRMVFQFEERQINGTLDNLADFMDNFINPRTPFGWDRVTKDLVQDPNQQPRVGQAPQGQQPAGR